MTAKGQRHILKTKTPFGEKWERLGEKQVEWERDLGKIRSPIEFQSDSDKNPSLSSSHHLTFTSVHPRDLKLDVSDREVWLAAQARIALGPQARLQLHQASHQLQPSCARYHGEVHSAAAIM